MVGQTLSHYRITAELGEGGTGEVHRAEDLNGLRILVRSPRSGFSRIVNKVILEQPLRKRP